MRTTIFQSLHVISIALILSGSGTAIAQYHPDQTWYDMQASYPAYSTPPTARLQSGGYPPVRYESTPVASAPMYVAKNDMMPQVRETRTTVPPNPYDPGRPTSATTVPPAPQTVSPRGGAAVEEDRYVQNTPAPAAKRSFFSSWLSPTKKPKESAKADENTDDGQEVVAAMMAQRSYSEEDYIASATKNQGASAKDYYLQGMDAEARGDYPLAATHYGAFIQANKRQTLNGTLAAPYHRLALIAWKQNQAHRNADTYFQYAMKYAREGNVLIIAGDYSLFLMEQERMDRAEIILRNALTHDPDNQRLLCYLGRCTAYQDRPIESLRYFTEAVGKERAYREVANIYRQRGEYDMAMRMDQRRDEYLAQNRRRAPQTPGSRPTSRELASSGSTGPITPPPVMSNPRGMLGNPTSVYPMPFPTFDNPEGRREQISATPSSLPTNMSPPNVGVPMIPDQGWQPYSPPVSTYVPSVDPSVPVSRVYHYPEGQSQSVYHEYRGEQYPRSSAPMTGYTRSTLDFPKPVSESHASQGDYRGRSPMPMPAAAYHQTVPTGYPIQGHFVPAQTFTGTPGTVPTTGQTVGMAHPGDTTFPPGTVLIQPQGNINWNPTLN